jgi:hypothetical protein
MGKALEIPIHCLALCEIQVKGCLVNVSMLQLLV